MSGSRFLRRSSFRMVTAVALVVVVTVLVALWIWPVSYPKNHSESGVGGIADASAPSDSGSSSSLVVSGAVRSSHQDFGQGELTPHEVIDNLDVYCNLKRGDGSASGLGLVTISGSTAPDSSTRFSVLGSTGAQYTGELPFLPFQSKLGKQPYGEAVMGFGGINVRSGFTPLPARGERLQVFLGDRKVLDKENVWLFDVAADGSSFFFIEPLGSEFSSRLVISNLNQGTEMHHYLDDLIASSDGALAYRAAYTPNSEEVHFQPVSESAAGIGVHYFFSAIREDSPRKILVPDRGLDDLVHFTSSKEGFFFFDSTNSADSLHITKAEFDWTTDTSEPIWHQEGPTGTKASRVDASPDGDWLLFTTRTSNAAGRPARDDDWTLSVLDSASGETLFSLPTHNTDALTRRLASVLPNEPVADDIGWFNGAYFAGDDKLVVRWIRLTDGDLDETTSFLDVFDMNSISRDADPLYRLASNEHRFNPCASRGFPGTLLIAENGRLAYSGLD